MYYHDLEVMSSKPGWVKLGVFEPKIYVLNHQYCRYIEAAEAGLVFFKLCVYPLWGDKVSMLIHIYPHKLLRKIEVTICKSPG